MILFINIWMYQGLQVANLVVGETIGVSVLQDRQALKRHILLSTVVGICWPGALALHMLQNEMAVNDE